MTEKGSQEETKAIGVETPAYATKSGGELVLPEALEDLMDLEDQDAGGLKSSDMDKSMNLDIYDDLYEVQPAGSKKSEKMDRSLELDIYDDLDDFQKAEDRNNKELQAWEAKYEKALAEIEALKVENKALGKKIKTMEVNLQNLLDTAKAEVKRKETLIAELRNEKDDVCFRRKRARPFEVPGAREPESKRQKEFQSKPIDVRKYSETDRNPFKTATKNGAKDDARKMMTSKDTKKVVSKDVERGAIFKEDKKTATLKDDVKKSFSKDDAWKSRTKEDAKKSFQRSKSPRPEHLKTTDRKSTAQTRRPDRHRSRSPKQNSRRDHHRNQESSPRHAKRRSHSASPSKINLPREKANAITKLTDDETNAQRSKSPVPVTAKLVTESQPAEKVKSNRKDAALETNANSLKESKVETKDITQPTDGLISEACIPKHEIIPGLSLLNPESEDFSKNEIKLDPIKKLSNPTEDNSAHQLLKKEPIPKVVILKKCKIIFAKDSPAVEQHLDKIKDEKESEEPQAKLDKKEHFAVKTGVETPSKEESNDDIVLSKNTTPQAEVCSQHEENDKAEIRGPTDEVVESDVGVRIIEDIRLPNMADIDNFAVKVDNHGEAPTAVTDSALNQQNLATQDQTICAEMKDPTISISSDESPIKSATVLYAKPDSTKLDHSDEHDEVILETAMDMLTKEQDAASNAESTYPKLRIAEDAIDMALEQLHQQSPDETTVTSTSNRAQQTPKSLITILTQTPKQGSPLRAVSPMETPKKTDTEKTPLKKRKVNMDSPPQVPAEDVTIDKTLGDSLQKGSSTVTKRCSMGHTDYQYEQIKDEVILRVKRRGRRRKPTPMEIPTTAEDKPI
ncbi:muscle M-line assembly protein unc-89 isoform X1 [Drosophila sechellia]|uniref:muscle M-line assembly protein unc-89 isoform X1 n=1 Tax=Drosophila sechellia TaxID=7238 RepID=UPI0013DD935D|nr:muscle M-line assembly protein unc-89 isoform X1 [Drosophila sechellia]